jgi:hypothetical protein
MTAKLTVTISLTGLPEKVDALDKLVSALQDRADWLVGMALSDSYEEGTHDKDWTITVRGHTE